MITLKQHIELSNHMGSADEIEGYLKEIDAIQKLKLYNSIEDTYPLKDSDNITDYVLDNFTHYDSAF